MQQHSPRPMPKARNQGVRFNPAGPASPKTIATELSQQRQQTRGWQSVELIDHGKKHTAIDSLSRITTDASISAWLVAVMAGVCLGLIGVGIEACTRFVVSFRIGICKNFFWLGPGICCAFSEEVGEECSDFAPWGVFFGGEGGRHAALLDCFFYIFWAAAFACTSAFFCKTFSPFAAGGGIIEVKTIVAGELLDRYLGWWTLTVKSVGVCMSTGSSLVVGKEGPFVHIGSCVCDILATKMGIHDDNQRRELIAAGAAGGVAVAFGAPIGGVIFAIEEISGQFKYRSMMQSLIVGTLGVLVVKMVDMFHTGRIVQFSINYSHEWHWFELPLFILCGALGGAVGATFNWGNQIWCGKRKKLWQQWKVTEVFVLVVLSASLHYVIPFCKGGMLELLADLYQDCAGSQVEICEKTDYEVMLYTIIAGTMKLVLAVVTVGCCVPAGLLVPSLCIGALYGRAFGIFISALSSSFESSWFFYECQGHTTCIVPGVYAIVGSAAVLCGVTRMTICLAVIMFELTGGLEYLVPIVFALLASKATAGTLFRMESIYDIGIEANKLPILEAHVRYDGPESVADLSNKNITILNAEETLQTLFDKTRQTEQHKQGPTGYPVVQEVNGVSMFRGYVERVDIERKMKELGEDDQSRLDHWLANGGPTAAEPEEPQPTSATTRVRFYHDENLVTHLQGPTAAATAGGNTTSTPPVEEEDDFVDMSGFLTRPPLTIEPNERVGRVIALFHSLHLARVVLTTSGEFKGIVSRIDLLNFIREKGHH